MSCLPAGVGSDYLSFVLSIDLQHASTGRGSRRAAAAVLRAARQATTRRETPRAYSAPSASLPPLTLGERRLACRFVAVRSRMRFSW
jgi:hypothetical protein